MRNANYSRSGYPMFHVGDAVRNNATGDLGVVIGFHEATPERQAFVAVKIDRFVNGSGWQTIYQYWLVSHVKAARL